jgi:hypothetical protein
MLNHAAAQRVDFRAELRLRLDCCYAGPMAWREQNDKPYELKAVLKADAPSGSQGENWIKYEITQGRNVITGYRQGSVTAIKRVAEEIVVGLNERRSPNRGRVQLTQLKKTVKTAAS